MTAKDFTEYILLWLKSNSKSIGYSTQVKYEQLIHNHIMPYFFQNRTDEVSEEMLKNYYGFMAASDCVRLSNGNLRTIFMIINNTMRWAYAHRFVDKKLYVKPQLKKEKPIVKVFSSSHQLKMERYILGNSNRYSMAILLALYSGIRIGELCSLKLSDIDFQNGCISITKTVQRLQIRGAGAPKTQLVISSPKSPSSRRLIPLPDFVVEYISGQCHCPDEEFYLLNQGRSTPLDPRVLQSGYKKILAVCEIPYLNFHCLRHTFATRCITLGWDMKTLSEILGHSDIKLTMDYYFHSSMEFKKQQINKLTLMS